MNPRFRDFCLECRDFETGLIFSEVHHFLIQHSIPPTWCQDKSRHYTTFDLDIHFASKLKFSFKFYGQVKGWDFFARWKNFLLVAWCYFIYLMVPFLVRFGGISGSFGLVMGILARLRLAKIRTMARPNSPDMPPKRTKKVRLGIFTVTKFSPKFSVTVVESGQWRDIVGYQDSRVGFWLANCEFGYGK